MNHSVIDKYKHTHTRCIHFGLAESVGTCRYRSCVSHGRPQANYYWAKAQRRRKGTSGATAQKSAATTATTTVDDKVATTTVDKKGAAA